MRRLAFALFALFPLVLAAPVRAEEPAKEFFFKPNDRIVFLGDSITQQYQYSSYIELYLTTRMPKGNFVFLNAGIGGDTANGGAGRFQNDVLNDKPTAVTINFGMNDGGYGKFNPAANKVFIEKTRAMLEMAKKAGVRVALCSPNAVDKRNKGNGAEYVETQKQFYAPLKDLAAEFKIPYADQYTLTRAATDAMEKDDPMAKTAKPYYDGFHTSPPGGLLMAGVILKELNAPAVVSSAEISADGPKVGPGKSTGCTISDLAAIEGGIAFTRLDESLPLPIQKDWLPMLPYMNGLKDLNWYGLTVSGLKAGDYDISIDGVKVAKATAKELAAGVNLGNVTSGPIYEQGSKVLNSINVKNAMVFDRFFNVVKFNVPGWVEESLPGIKAKELTKRMEKIDKAQADIYKLAEPKSHMFTVTPLAK
jgi:lysophospholipase L1-like esterase